MLNDDYFKELGHEGFKKVLAIKHFYKYIDLQASITHLLKENTFKFSNPDDFNDPFDCNEYLVDISIPTEKEREFILQAAANNKLPRNIVRKQLRNIGNSKIYSEALGKKKKEFKVSCFSEVSDNILMWSHYADKHKGICIGFDLAHACEDYVLYPVNYISQVQKIDGMTNTPYVFYHLVTVKADCWAYEKEIRAVSKNGNPLQQFPKEAVKEIIFGCKVKPSTISSTVKEIKKIGYRNVSFYKMEIDVKTLKLKKVKL
jgi:hypothetical protein